jgi:dethiobiotin synthetase
MSGFSCFVTGIDTGIGKTLVSCALIYAQAQQGLRIAGMKPVAAGAAQYEGVWHNEDADALALASNIKLPAELTTPYLLKTAAAPHIAAALEHVSIDFAYIHTCFQKIRARADAVVVEGIGGFRVPLTESLDSADLALQFGLPVVLVVGMRLGCISQGLLTAESIAARGLKLVGWVANCIDPSMAYCTENIAALEKRLTAPLLGTIPYADSVSAAQAAAYLDFSALPGWPQRH